MTHVYSQYPLAYYASLVCELLYVVVKSGLRARAAPIIIVE